VLDPLRLQIDNRPAGHVELVTVANNPEDPAAGSRTVPFAGELWIEREDFMESPPADFFRLAPGREVRLRAGFFVRCTGIDRGPDGAVAAVRCSYDPATRGGNAPDGRKVKATIHWVSAAHAVPVEVRLLDHLFTDPDPAGRPDGDFLSVLNPRSLVTVTAMAEPALQQAQPGERFQFERLGYFFCDPVDSRPDAPRFHRTVTLKDAWQKAKKKQEPKAR
jgi:glutaminyl-tRNA synthetase